MAFPKVFGVSSHAWLRIELLVIARLKNDPKTLNPWYFAGSIRAGVLRKPSCVWLDRRLGLGVACYKKLKERFTSPNQKPLALFTQNATDLSGTSRRGLHEWLLPHTNSRIVLIFIFFLPSSCRTTVSTFAQLCP